MDKKWCELNWKKWFVSFKRKVQRRNCTQTAFLSSTSNAIDQMKSGWKWNVQRVEIQNATNRQRIKPKLSLFPVTHFPVTLNTR